MFWVGIYLPLLPLESLYRGIVASYPLAISSLGHRPVVVCCNQAAAQCGVKSGMALSAAQALTPHLVNHTRDRATEISALHNLAAWACHFTPAVSLVADCGILLEIESSLRLFGGVRPLLKKLRQELEQTGYTALANGAATALGAWYLCRAGSRWQVVRREALLARLSTLPVSVLDIDAKTLQALQMLAVDTLGACRALPRDGLARRFGQALLDNLAKAFGELPDPRHFFKPPDRFESKLELPAEAEDAEALLFAARQLLVELENFLRGRGAGVTRFDLTLNHADHDPTRIAIQLAAANRGARHFTLLTRERLARTQLPRPVRSLALTATEIRPLDARNFSLFPDATQTSEQQQQLIERLRARLGSNAVQGLAAAADHRPEYAWRYDADDKNAARVFPSRPLWLLAKPCPIATVTNEPEISGPLALLAGPERIETGWWDEHDVERDYYVAENPQGEKYWIFRERAGAWFLHGIFA